MNTIPIYETQAIIDALAFYAMCGRSMSSEEIWGVLPVNMRPTDINELNEIIDFIESRGIIERIGGKMSISYVGTPNKLKEEERESILSYKWEELSYNRHLFSRIPFLNFALVSGSIALNSVSDKSDFDITIGSKRGRIFTVRFFVLLVFWMRGVLRRANHSKEEAKNMFCFPHFVTPDGYRKMGKHTKGWGEIYRNIVPLYGSQEEIIKFFVENKWCDRGLISFDKRWLDKNKNILRSFFELMLSGLMGNIFESFVKKIQLNRIKKKRKHINTYMDARIYAGDEELEFHLRDNEFNNKWDNMEKHINALGLRSFV